MKKLIAMLPVRFWRTAIAGRTKDAECAILKTPEE